MITFGDQTGSHREFQEAMDANLRVGNIVTDNSKNLWQVSTAQVMSVVDIEDPNKEIDANATVNKDKTECRSYTVLVLREQREIPSRMHKQDNSYWAMSSFPKVGDFVRIRHKRDLFEAEIIENVTVTESEARSIFAAVTKKAG